MYELKKIGKVQTSNSVGTRPSSYEKRIYRTAVSQGSRNTEQDYYVLRRLMSQEDFTALMHQESFTSYAEVSLVTALVS